MKFPTLVIFLPELFPGNIHILSFRFLRQRKKRLRLRVGDGNPQRIPSTKCIKSCL